MPKPITYSNGSTPKVCIVGAGFSGILAGIKLSTELGLKTFTIFDENDEVGGTWLVNTYPGCACDVRSHLYSYSFEQNPYWSQNYSPQEEIWAYLRNVAKKYDLYRNIKFHSMVKQLKWDDVINKWRVTVYDKNTKETNELLFDIVINSPGALRVPNIPEEFKKFKGPILHSGAWDKTIEWENKVVALVGSGSSAIQMVPEVASKVTELHCYQRKPAWVMPRRQFKFPEILQWLFAHVPLLLLIYRWVIFLFAEFFHPVFLHGSRMGRFATWVGTYHMNNQVKENEKLRKELLPNYRVGCKRIIVSNEYFPAMQLPHVKLHTESILKVKDNSLVTEKGEVKIDVLMLATGFRVQEYFAPMEIIGKNNHDIMTLWKKFGPRSYYGIIGSLTPNQFVLLGPNTGLGHNTIIFMIECQMNFIVKVMREMMKRDAKVIELKKEAEDVFQESIEKGLEKTVWGNEKCGSWYANADGVITTLWPWSCINYWRKTLVPDYSVFDFK